MASRYQLHEQFNEVTFSGEASPDDVALTFQRMREDDRYQPGTPLLLNDTGSSFMPTAEDVWKIVALWSNMGIPRCKC